MSGMEFSGAGVKHDLGKPRYDLVPTRAVREFVEVLTFGAKKYTANGWRKVVGWRWRYLRAALTHVFQFLGGQARDPETNLHHLAHALCCLFFVLEHELILELGTKAERALVPDGDAEAPPGSQEAPNFETKMDPNGAPDRWSLVNGKRKRKGRGR